MAEINCSSVRLIWEDGRLYSAKLAHIVNGIPATMSFALVIGLILRAKYLHSNVRLLLANVTAATYATALGMVIHPKFLH